MAELFLLLVALGSQGAGRITTAHDNPHRQHDLPLQAAAQAEGAGLAEITGPAVVTTKQRATLHPTGGTPSTPAAPTPANDDGPKVGKSAIVTSRKPQTWRSDVRRRNTSGEAMQPTLAASYVVVLVWCKSCRHQAQADMQKLIDTGMGNVPLTQLRFRCSN